MMGAINPITMKFILSSLVAASFILSALPAAAADTTRPVVGAPSPANATAGVQVTVSASVSDDESGIATCSLYVDNDDVGAMTVEGNTATKTYAFAQAGIHTMFVFCRDNVNNFNSSLNTSISVSSGGGGGGGDVTPPTVSAISPTTASVGSAVEFVANASDAGTGVSGCTLFVNGFSKGAMVYSSGTARLTQTFSAAGIQSVRAECFDVAGNTGVGETTNVQVSVKVGVSPGLVKAACPSVAEASHPCRAVYYRASDGTRHAFPNERVFFSWYADFSSVQEVSADTLASYPLSKGVTYRPGSKLVKFTTLAKVYAVAKGGTLRWITSEAAASSLYGADWNKKVDDISDVFFLDYRFGADVETVQDFSPDAERASAPSVESNF